MPKKSLPTPVPAESGVLIKPETPPIYKRFSQTASKRIVIGFVLSLLTISAATTWVIQRGRTDANFQADLSEFRQSLLPNMLNAEIAATPAYEDLTRELRRMIEIEMADKQIPALSIALVEGNGLQWARGFGLADSVENVPAMPQTIYRVASISKLFTAVGIMKLVEDKKLELDDPVIKYLPELDWSHPSGKPVTIRHLLSHRSGILREPPQGSYFDDSSPTIETTVNSMAGTPVFFEPGDYSKYSNAAFTVLGRIIETQTATPFAEWMKDQILTPLTMNESSFSPDRLLMRRLADSYMWSYEGERWQAPVFEMGIAPAAGLYTSVLDLSRFLSMLFQEGLLPDGSRLIRAETLHEMWKPQLTDENTGFGLGFYVGDHNGKKRIQHSGVQYGFASRVYAIPELGLGVAISANLDNANAVVDAIGEYALDLMAARLEQTNVDDYEETAPLSASVTAGLLGRYQQSGTMVTIFREGENVLLDDGNRVLRLRSRGSKVLVDDVLTIGTVVEKTVTGVKIGETEYQRSEQNSTVYPKRWEKLVGAYGWPHNTLYIFPRDGQLHVLIEWFDRYPLRETGDDHFVLSADGMYNFEPVTFSRGQGGSTTGVRLGGVLFKRLGDVPSFYLQEAISYANDDATVYRITPLRTPDELRRRALEATPPRSTGSAQGDLIEPVFLDPTIQLDIRYASERNFMGMPFYDEPRAFLQRPAAEALVRAHRSLSSLGYGLLIFDAYRPWYVTKMFWDATPGRQKEFVAKPTDGSRHNRGCAVDVSLFDRASGAEIPMPSGYDEFTDRAYASYSGGTAEQRRNRSVLRSAMEAEGFRVIHNEWWHFDYQNWQSYAISNLRFDEL